MKVFMGMIVFGVFSGTFSGGTEEESQPPTALESEGSQAIGQIEEVGGGVRKIASNDERWEVDFHLQGFSLNPDDQLAHLKDLSNVAYLHLGNTSVTDRGMAQLAGLTTLTRLHLEKTKISDAGLEYLKNLHNLSYLNLYGTAITDAGLVHLESLTNLKKLYLWQTQVTNTGVKKLQQALPSLDINRGWEVADQ